MRRGKNTIRRLAEYIRLLSHVTSARLRLPVLLYIVLASQARIDDLETASYAILQTTVFKVTVIVINYNSIHIEGAASASPARICYASNTKACLRRSPSRLPRKLEDE